MYPNGNENCLWCGNNDYPDVTITREQDYYEYRCAKCDGLLARRIVSTDGEQASVPRWVSLPNHVIRRYPFRSTVHWDTIEVWWDHFDTAVLFHGYPLTGSDDFLNIISTLEEYDS